MYCDIEDLKSTYGERVILQLIDEEGAGAIGAGNIHRVDRAISRADSFINASVGRRYSLPLADIPEVLKSIALPLTIYFLCDKNPGAKKERKPDYDDARADLERIAKGTLTLAVSDPGGNPPPSEAPIIAGSNPKRVFSRESMGGF